MMSHHDMIAIIQAHATGKQLQFRNRNLGSPFVDLNRKCFSANFETYDYRIKREPRRWFIRINDQGYIPSGDQVLADNPDVLADVMVDGDRIIAVREVLEGE